MKNILAFLLVMIAAAALAHQPVVVGQEPITIADPDISRAFYDELAGQPRSYFINADKGFALYLNLLVPLQTNSEGRYSARIYRLTGEKKALLADLKADSAVWQEYYEPFGGDHYLKGPEYKQSVPAGRYEIEVYSADNEGKYVLAVGEKEHFGLKEIVNVYKVLPGLKVNFFGGEFYSFLVTPFGLALLFVVGVVVLILAKIFIL